MKIFTIQSAGKESKILVSEKISHLSELIPSHAVIITDSVVNELYGEFWKDHPSIIIEKGEKNKTLDTMVFIYQRLLELGVDRSGFVVGIGGGIVCDIAGFAASTYMRGLKFAFVPTTLLAQVDASIGGKNGVNFQGLKNMVGTFNQPEFILSDPRVLKTLPAEELSNGFAEIVKHALIANEELFVFIQNNVSKMLQLDPITINHLIKTSVEIKSGIVNRDEKEMGERRILNFGHTFGHAIERVTGISHGKAVSLGTVIAARLSLQKGYIGMGDYESIVSVLEQLQLPVHLDLDTSELLDALLKDKKREQQSMNFIFLKAIGCAFVEKLSLEDLKDIKL